jgi:Holliday junction resolvasome RuvABC endonuclease subunit
VVAPKTILGWDQSSSTSGWAILVLSPYQPVYLPHSSGVLKSVGTAESALRVDSLIATAVDLGRPVLAVLERHPAYGRAKTVAALARAQGALQQALGTRLIHGRALISATPTEWRKKVLQLPHNAPREQCKAAAVQYARQHRGLDYREDPSEALCLAYFGAGRSHLGYSYE